MSEGQSLTYRLLKITEARDGNVYGVIEKCFSPFIRNKRYKAYVPPEIQAMFFSLVRKIYSHYSIECLKEGYGEFEYMVVEMKETDFKVLRSVPQFKEIGMIATWNEEKGELILTLPDKAETNFMKTIFLRLEKWKEARKTMIQVREARAKLTTMAQAFEQAIIGLSNDAACLRQYTRPVFYGVENKYRALNVYPNAEIPAQTIYFQQEEEVLKHRLF